jgi:hypothetical protein
LLQESITIDEVAHAEQLLFHFCVMFEPWYGKRFQTANIHGLVHLADNVRELGLLWTYSCFHFEDKNGFLLKTIHGTQQIQFQIISVLLNGSNECEFYHKLIGKEKRRRMRYNFHKSVTGSVELAGVNFPLSSLRRFLKHLVLHLQT